MLDLHEHFQEISNASSAMQRVCDVLGVFRSTGRTAGIHALRQLMSDSRTIEESELRPGFLKATIAALESDNWGEVSRAFQRKDFIGATGRFLLVGPYRIMRSGQAFDQLTGVLGESIPTPPFRDFGTMIDDLLGKRLENSSEVVPFNCVGCFGHAEGMSGEAFLVPDGWIWPDPQEGPALNNMTEQQRRFELLGRNCVSAIFSEASAIFLLRPLLDVQFHQQLRHQEFQFHEAGHACGIGLRKKLHRKLLSTAWHRGVEEWRADGVEFEFLSRELTAERAGMAIAANYCLRFGIDAHREGGPEQDTDVIASMLSLNSLLRSGSLFVDTNRQLAFQDETYEGLLHATAGHRRDAVNLSRNELVLESEQGLADLYSSLNVDPTTEALFNSAVRGPCLGFAAGLR